MECHSHFVESLAPLHCPYPCNLLRTPPQPLHPPLASFQLRSIRHFPPPCTFDPAPPSLASLHLERMVSSQPSSSTHLQTPALTPYEVMSHSITAPIAESVTSSICARSPITGLSASKTAFKEMNRSRSRRCFHDKHTRRLHTARTPKKRFPCSVCPSTFTRRCDLEKHGLIVHKKLRLWMCEICAKPFGQRHHMERHVRAIHQKQRPFECVLCPMRFSRKEHVANHERAVHGVGKATKCPLCDTKYVEKGELPLHLGNVHSVKSTRVGALADWYPNGRGRAQAKRVIEVGGEL